MRRDDRRRPADAAGGVHAHHRLPVRAEGVRHRELGHHHALERVGRLAEHDGVDVGPGHLGVVERALRGLADEPRERDVVALLLVLRLSDADDGAGLGRHAQSPSRTATRFCWSA
jgi:hypothetical protein